jgi:hypothetical protein
MGRRILLRPRPRDARPESCNFWSVSFPGHRKWNLTAPFSNHFGTRRIQLFNSARGHAADIGVMKRKGIIFNRKKRNWLEATHRLSLPLFVREQVVGEGEVHLDGVVAALAWTLHDEPRWRGAPFWVLFTTAVQYFGSPPAFRQIMRRA